MEAILLSPLMCVYIVIIVTNLAVTLWRVDSPADLKYNCYWLESSVAGRLDKGLTARECTVLEECILGV